MTGDAIPRITHGVFHLLPGRVAAVLVRAPAARQLGLDIAPLATLMSVRRLVAVAVPAFPQTVVGRARPLRPGPEVLPPVRVFVVPRRGFVAVLHSRTSLRGIDARCGVPAIRYGRA